MVGAKYVLLSAIKLATDFHLKWHTNENKKQSRPQPIKYTGQPKLPGKKHWDQEEWE